MLRHTLKEVAWILLFCLIGLAFAFALGEWSRGQDLIVIAPQTKATVFRVPALPAQSGPLNIVPSAAQIELGREMFFHKGLSQDGTVSCASCHDPDKGFADGLSLAVGIAGQVGTRNTPTALGAVHSVLQFHDGRTVGQITQALLPLSNPIEMGRQSELEFLTKLRIEPKYVTAFSAAFPLEVVDQNPILAVDRQTLNPITGPRLGFVIAAFETTLVSSDAPVDRRLTGDGDALTPEAEIGFGIFVKANCAQCHTPPLWTTNLFANNGMEHAGRVRGERFDQGRLTVVPVNLRTAADVRAFKVPTLREIQRTAPYGHHGRFVDLASVVAHYNRGGAGPNGKRDPYISQRIKPLGLNATQQAYLVAFLKEGFRGRNYPHVKAP